MTSTAKCLRLRASIAVVATLALAASASADGGFDIPTGAPASPLFGTLPFTQAVPLFEEFGTTYLPAVDCPGCAAAPVPATCINGPDGAAIDTFLKQSLSPLPTREANILRPNPWAAKIGDCIQKPLKKSAIEGRPSGEFFAHQRWDEFYPKVYFQSAQAGARSNGGLRDLAQRHQFAVGEFAPGGLYYRGGSNKYTKVQIHPNMPVQNANSIWTFDGTLPPKLLMARYGEPILFRHYNVLPIDEAANAGFGGHTITTHQHNGHNPAESDGYAAAFFFPGQFYDYQWPMILSGYDTINADASDTRAAAPDGIGGTIQIPGDWRTTQSTLWFHDHMLDFTAQNVYKGNAAMMNIYSALDRGREGVQCNYANPLNVNLCFPSGTALDWGNRDYDVNLLVADKAWDKNGQLFFNVFNLDGFLADRMTVNWAYKPYLEVRARRYRLRILNGSVSRFFKIAIVTAAGQRVPFHLIANDGNVMEHAVAFPNAQSQDLPAQGIGERYDIVIDFKPYAVDTKLYLVNVLEHQDGKGPKGTVPLADAFSGKYVGDPAVGKFMEFRVKAYAGQDTSMNPAAYVEGKKKMIPLPMPTSAELATARHRSFEFGRSSGTDHAPWTIKTDGGQGFAMDPHRISLAPTTNSLEIWHFSGGGGWSHPVHPHFEEGIILARDGHAPPAWERLSRKDMFRIGDAPDSSREVDIAIRFRDFLGTYMEHCHNTQHEDHAQLLRWDLKNPGAATAIPTPIQTWEGTYYEPSFSIATGN
jgi:FtsP/CotA-like multicopper oxidase with cupredoxin domain